MLKIYDVVLMMAGDAAGIAERIERKDRDLARQMRRAVQSVALNVAEGMGCLAGHKRQRYSTALGSAREVMACVQVAQAMRYIESPHPDVLDRMNHIIATLARLVYRRAS
ncbi:four helix bundle protein [Polyangium fumosum]|uniref:Four helix bundle protein n=1 Tax=Polyangium fumosum TaxID=889272 RepID=A0A4U1IVA8_9BACT|nr:four helix bundle protein [Polyangium fumosum]TKC97916.1 four helix bundle protein [Polyangium fumosum]